MDQTPCHRAILSRRRKHRRLTLEVLDDRRLLALTIGLSNNIVAENSAGAVIGNLSVTDTAEPVLVQFTAKAVTISATPFGLTSAQAMGQMVTGFFRYDRNTLDVEASSNRGYYPHSEGGGAFRAESLGVVITGSATPYLEVENLASDTFRFIDGPRTIGHAGDVMSVNGTADPTVELWIAFVDGGATAFSTDALTNPLPYAVAPLNTPAPFWFPHTFSLKDGGGTMLLQLESLTMGTVPVETFTYAVTDNRFEIVNTNQLKLKAGQSLNYEAGANIALSILANGSSGQSKQQVLNIDVSNVNEAPTALTLSNLNINENAIGATIANINVVDPDAGSTFTYLFSDSRFEAIGNQLKLKAGISLNFENETSIPLTITARDAGALTVSNTLTLNVVNVNEVPHDIVVSRSTIFANLDGAWVADLTTLDVDAGDTHAYTVSDSRFTITAGGLYLKAGQTVPATPATVALVITATDKGGTGLPFAKGVNLTVLPAPANWVQPYQWALRPADINADGMVFATDAALIINAINAGLALGPTVPAGTARPYFYDASGDGIINPADAADVINYLNATGGGEAPFMEARDERPASLSLAIIDETPSTKTPEWLWPLTTETARNSLPPQTTKALPLVWPLALTTAPLLWLASSTTATSMTTPDNYIAEEAFEAWWLALWAEDEHDNQPTAL